MSASQEPELIQPSLGTPFRRRARVYLMTGIICSAVVLVLGLVLVVSNSGKVRPTRAADTSTGTGAAKVTSVTITQAGTGASVTIGGETTTPTGEVLDETQYGDNAARRKILNNNVAVYKVNYNVTQAGKVTLKFKLPANTPIDRSSIAGCADGSNLSTASSVNPWNGETEQSYAYNVAECVINADSAGAGEWVVKANLWGGNGEKITPTIAVNDVSQNVQIEPITILARADYYASVTSYLAKQSPSGGRNNESSLSIILSSPITNSDVAGLGIEPLESGLKLQLSTNLPASSTVGWLQIRGAGCDPLTKGAGVRDCTMVAGVHNGSITANMGSDGVITYQVGGVVSGAHWCPKEWTSSCVVIQTSSIVGVLTSELTLTEKQFEAKFVDATYKTRSSGETTIKGQSTRKWTLRNRSYGNPVAWFSPPQIWSGVDGLESYQDRRPVYRGEEISRGAWVQMNTTVDSNYTNNFYYCQTFNPSLVKITGEFVVGSSRVAGNFNVYGDGKVGVQYGVITGPSNVTPNSNKTICGQYGKGDVENEDGIYASRFFDKLSDAEAYAAQNNLRVNAVRVWVEKVRVIRDGWTGSYPAKVLGAAGDENGTLAEFNASGETDEWREYDSGGDSEVPVSGRGVVIVPGFLRVDTGVTDGDIYPGGTTTLVLKPITWNNDTNAKITVTIPKGLSLKSGSIKQNGLALAANNYTATKNDDGTTAVEITGSPIAGEEPTETLDATGLTSDVQAADNGGKGVEHSPVTMELVADENATTPSSVALQVESSGMGTNRTVETFRKKSLSISLATPPKTFSYGMASSAATLYPTEDLDYTLTAGNSTDNSTDDGGIDTVNVLPYDGDSRGTTNLKSYSVESFSLSSVNVDNVRLYYTTDMTVRDMDKVSGSDATAASGVLKIADDDGQVKWTECALVDGVCNLPDGAAATAVRIKTGAMASGGNLKLKYTLSNILPVDSTKSGAINNDLAYMAASGAIDPAAHVGNANTDYSGNVVGLSLSSDDGAVDKDGALTISKQLDVNSLVKATIKADVAAATLNGADFTVDVPIEMTGVRQSGDGKVKLKALSDGLVPAAGTPGYSLQLDGGVWSASQAKFILPGNARQTLLTVFAAGSSTATPADTYTGKITFTITARQ